MLRDVWPAHMKPDFGMDYALPLKWQQGLGAVGLWPRCSFDGAACGAVRLAIICHLLGLFAVPVPPPQ